MFKKAERKKAKLRLGICGPSGSGKTWSSLLIATGIGNKIALLDTERRGHLYAGDFNFDLCELDAPYSPEKYIESIKTAEKLGYEVLIIDSLSHAWIGEGGVLSIAERAGGTFQQGWKTATPKQNLLVDTIITSNLHIITTLRSKTDYVMEQNEKGKVAPRKVGLAPVQRDGLEYEFTIFMDMNLDHFATVSKDNTNIYQGQIIKPTKDMGHKLVEWLNTGKSSEEIIEEEFHIIEDRLKHSKNTQELTFYYNDAVAKFPSLKEKIIPIAREVKSQLLEVAL